MACTRNYKKWTADEEDQLQKIYENSNCFKYTANKLCRSQDAVQARYVKNVICAEYTINHILTNLNELAQEYKLDIDDFKRYLKYAGIRHKSLDYNEYEESESESDGSDGSDGSDVSDDSDEDYHPTDDSDSDDSEYSDVSESSEFSDSVKEKKSVVKYKPHQVNLKLRFNINLNPFLVAAVLGGLTAYGLYYYKLIRYV